MILTLGIGAIVAGVILFFLSIRQQQKVSASGGSIAVGGKNTGTITNTNTAGSGHGAGHSVLTILAIVVELAGIAATVWHLLTK
ncbi:hypothetical protein [Paraburkholderia sp. MM5384-R2]|uniref:hypothetical protein n=1 Tax=Paraburkholderia sp. MM5384-R2 TaxID=2723097 RepID=UPI0016087809|nr:hypothetical protein [Paraburkholderia sp. MM5384-R2]MBB5498682.1 hypothetical protein [Paraburkholderia sp. MM5384-R2]